MAVIQELPDRPHHEEVDPILGPKSPLLPYPISDYQFLEAMNDIVGRRLSDDEVGIAGFVRSGFYAEMLRRAQEERRERIASEVGTSSFTTTVKGEGSNLIFKFKLDGGFWVDSSTIQDKTKVVFNASRDYEFSPGALYDLAFVKITSAFFSQDPDVPKGYALKWLSRAWIKMGDSPQRGHDISNPDVEREFETSMREKDKIKWASMTVDVPGKGVFGIALPNPRLSKDYLFTFSFPSAWRMNEQIIAELMSFHRDRDQLAKDPAAHISLANSINDIPVAVRSN